MKVLVVHQHYLFAGQPGGSRFNEMARLWIDAGHQVTVIAGTLNYATGVHHPVLGRRWCTRVIEDGVTVWRCYVPATYNSSRLGRMWAFFAFMLSASWAAFRVERPDVVIASSPPLTLVVPAWLAAKARRNPAPWVFEIRDLWPESAVTTGVLSAKGWLTRLLYDMEKWACRSANAINVLTPAFRDDLASRQLAPLEKIFFVPNGADINVFRGCDAAAGVRAEMGWGSRLVAVYAGAHGRANALDQLIEAAECLRDRPDILIAGVGDGPQRESLIAEVRRRGLGNITFHGPVPKERMPDILAAADIGLAVLQDNPTFRTVYPNKVFDYMTCERPIVLAIDGIARRLVCDEAEAGVFAAPEDGQAIARAILTLADEPGRRAQLGANGRRWVIGNVTRQSLAARYLEHLAAVIKGVPVSLKSEAARTVA